MIAGGSDNDTLSGGAGADTLRGGAGNDSYVIDNAGDVIEDTLGVDTVELAFSTPSYSIAALAALENVLVTAPGSINLTGNAGDNLLIGGAGNDTLIGGAGNDTLDGGAGNDTVSYAGATAAVTVNLAAGSASGGAGNDSLAGVENVLGGAGNDSVTGDAGANVLDGGAGNDTLDGGAGNDLLIGGAGNDTYVVGSAGDLPSETLAGAGNGLTDTVRAAASHTLGANLERLVLEEGFGPLAGTGNELANTLTGNASANLLVGNGGDDTLDGGPGADVMQGGTGNDRYVVDHAGDAISDSAGIDLVEASVTYALAALLENLTLTGSADVDGTGNALANRLTGNDGHNRLDGGAGADTLAGGAGNDRYVLDAPGDVVQELAEQGSDTIHSPLTTTLPAQVENLVLTGTANLNATGNTQDNALTGNSGANVLDGGAGNDTLAGGAGDDTYIVDAGDIVIELAGQGVDTLVTQGSVVLSPAIENLVLTGAGSTAVTGNGANNLLRGNSGNDTLDGGAGLDTLQGGAGNDTYVIDRLLEQGNISDSSGLDTVVSGARATGLGNGLENLTLTGSAFVGNGNSADNLIIGTGHLDVLFGGAGADTLDGGGGDDFLFGGDGNDVFLVDSAADFAIEFGGPGTGIDTVRSSALAFDLSTHGLHVERLVLVDGALAGTGNALANTLTGNSANNTLAGGAGNDTLTGGAGADAFVFDTAPGAANRDLIADFNTGEGDRLVLDLQVFAVAGTPGGTLSESQFRKAAGAVAAADADDRIILNTTSGALYYDADGVGGAAPVQLATVAGPTPLALITAGMFELGE